MSDKDSSASLSMQPCSECQKGSSEVQCNTLAESNDRKRWSKRIIIGSKNAPSPGYQLSRFALTSSMPVGVSKSWLHQIWNTAECHTKRVQIEMHGSSLTCNLSLLGLACPNLSSSTCPKHRCNFHTLGAFERTLLPRMLVAQVDCCLESAMNERENRTFCSSF